jgi:hypothetical protein
MQFGESFGEDCRFCGSTKIIVSPPSSAGNCAQCSEEAKAWVNRQALLAEHQAAMARVLIDGAAEKRRAAERMRRWSDRRASVADACSALLRGTVALVGAVSRPASTFVVKRITDAPGRAS